MNEIDEIKKALLEKCKENGGTITDLDILFIFPKPKGVQIGGINEADFVSNFNKYKEVIKGRKSMIRGLSRTAKNNLKRITERGYTWTDLRNAIEGMYMVAGSGKSWAERTGNDNPEHLLRENNFERYLNIYHNGFTGEKNVRTVDEKRREAFERVTFGHSKGS